MDSAVKESVVTHPTASEQVGLLRQIREDVDCVVQRDAAASGRLALLATDPGLQAILLYRIAHRQWIRGRRYLPRFLSYIARTRTSIDIHPGACIGRRFFIGQPERVVIGEHTVLGDDVTLYHSSMLDGALGNKGRRQPSFYGGGNGEETTWTRQ